MEVSTDQSINQYLEKVGLGAVTHNSSVPKYTELSQDELKRLSPNECTEIAYLLSREAFFIQKLINIHHARINTLHRKIDYLIAKKLGQYDPYMKYEQKKLCAIQDDDALQKMYEQIQEMQTKYELLLYIPTMLKNQTDTLVELSRVKRGGQK
jgi:hypothetical protein